MVAVEDSDILLIISLICIVGLWLCTIKRLNNIENKLQSKEICVMTALDFQKEKSELKIK